MILALSLIQLILSCPRAFGTDLFVSYCLWNFQLRRSQDFQAFKFENLVWKDQKCYCSWNVVQSVETRSINIEDSPSDHVDSSFWWFSELHQFPNSLFVFILITSVVLLLYLCFLFSRNKLLSASLYELASISSIVPNLFEHATLKELGNLIAI